MTWSQLKVVFFIIFTISAIIAIFFTFVGLWFVLPFAGLEMLLFFSALYYVSQKTSKVEIIDIEEGQFLLRVWKSGVEQRYKWYLPWVNIELQNMRFDFEKKRLLVRYKNERVEIANGLHEEEKNMLATALKKAIAAAI